jgi:predicted  nucleic acid-binding Zn-ribbon protein
VSFHYVSAAFESDFRAGYMRGKELYEYESKVTSLHKRLKKIERKIHQKEEALYAVNLSDVQRAELRSEIRTLDLEYREISLELKYMEKSRPLARVQ